ncbi:MAG TPA: 16S rRNA (adenine(1518)-N(6)/adenine(1519)-N(6))-dimethyltransferase RsmA [Terriglobia bacterium]|nr:16S rRNA (adenine(1518)-N(6)/adenine(1519)-N(6))-dimethyltransferase RsmA [Terriglobia bacterium]
MKKRFGQHFLTDPSILRRIVQLAQLAPEDTVVEIGPGAGSLTRELAAVANRVIAIEIDRDLIPGLRQSLPPNVDVIEGDALSVEFPRDEFHLVGNLPYNVATPLFKRFIENRARIRDVTVMIQKEVADRLNAKPGTPEYGPLSILIQYYATVKYGFKVSPGSFRPPPKVDSAVVRLEWKQDVPDAKPFTDFVHHAFGSRRKKLVNNLLSMFGSLGREEVLHRLANAGISVDARPEQLSVAEFLRVYNQFCCSSRVTRHSKSFPSEA